MDRYRRPVLSALDQSLPQRRSPGRVQTMHRLHDRPLADMDLVAIRWTLAGKTKNAVTLRVRPMVSGRDYHATHHMNDSLSTTTATTVIDGLVSWRPYSELPSVQALQNGEYRHDP